MRASSQSTSFPSIQIFAVLSMGILHTFPAIASPISDVVPLTSSDAATAFSTRAAASVSPRNSSSIATEMIAARGSACPVPAMSGAEPCTGSNNDGPVRVGEDVAEQVVGDDHVVAARILDEVDAGGVDVLVARRDVAVFGRDVVEGALPEVARERQDVRLVHQ